MELVAPKKTRQWAKLMISMAGGPGMEEGPETHDLDRLPTAAEVGL